MQMRSGVDYEERYDFENPGVAASNHIAALVRNTARVTAVARTLPRIHAAGEHFQYKTIDTTVLGFPPGDNSALDDETLAYMAAASAWQPR